MKHLSLLAFPLCTLISTGVLAQTEATPPPAAPPPSEPAAPVAAPAEATAPDAAPPEGEAPSVVAYGGRVRFGASAGLGAFLNPGAVMFGAEGRVGYQLDQMLGAYVAFQEAGGIGLTANSGGGSVTGVGYWRLALVGEATLGNRFFVGAGPALLNGAWATVGANVSNGSANAGVTTVSGYVPAANVRLGIGFGSPNASGRRTGFNMALDTTFAFSAGGMSIAPLLVFGFESK
ncbi:MAG: hypothetical protein ACYC8T_27780 [Myxococcaceae bacterium]